MAKNIGRIFENSMELVGRSYSTEVAAKEGLETFVNSLSKSASPVEGAMRGIFSHASVREVDSKNATFKVFFHGEPADNIITPVIRSLRLGDVESIARSLSLKPSDLGTRTFRDRLAKYSQDHFPDYHILQEAKAAERSLPTSLRVKTSRLRPGTAEELLHAIRHDHELNRLVKRVANHIRSNGNSRFAYVSTFFTIAGVVGTVEAVALALHEQAKRSAGCWRIYNDAVTGQIRSCKILQASCANKDATEGTVCDRTPISFHANMCHDAASGDECVHCDPAQITKPNQYISPSQYLDPNDLYVCRPVASIGEMLGKIIADTPTLAKAVAMDVVSTVSRFWDGVKYFIIAGCGLLLIGIMMYVYFTRFTAVDQYETYGVERTPLLNVDNTSSEKRSGVYVVK